MKISNTEEASMWSYNERRMLKYMLENDFMMFTRYFFRLREGSKMIINWHHYIIAYVLQAVIDLKIKRLIINIAPGYTKTEAAVLSFISYGLAKFPKSKYIHASYSGDLANQNSSAIKDTVLSAEFQELWPMSIRLDSKGKKRWFTGDGGGMMAAPSGGQITGFRAGRMNREEFTGAFILDDPLKPDDAYSDVRRTAINNRFDNTMRSRLAVDTVPFIIIMQRIHEEDLTGYLLKGGSGDVWHHLSIPTLLDEETLNMKYPEEHTHGIEIKLQGIIDSVRGRSDYVF